MAEKTEPEGEGVDLFGDPWSPPKETRGRKAHKRSPQLAEKVAVLRAAGATEEEIEARISLSVKTLRKYYSRELDRGPSLARAMLDEVMYAKAMTGNASAARYMDQRFKEGGVSLAAQRLKARAAAVTDQPATREAAPAPEPKLGKKEERKAAAQQIASGNSRFAVPPPPKLVVNNQ